MTEREPLIPGFNISHDLKSEFPTLYRRQKFGYEPHDLFVTEGSTRDDLTSPYLFLTAETAEEFKTSFEDLNIAFRYQLRADSGSNKTTTDMPQHQTEIFPASLTPNEDLEQLACMMEDSVETISDTKYLYSSFNSAITFDDCREMIKGSELVLNPESRGICSLKLDPILFNAEMFQYRQNVKVEGGVNHGTTGRPRIEDVYLGYDETEVDDIEEALESKGFNVNRRKLPSNQYPEDLIT